MLKIDNSNDNTPINIKSESKSPDDPDKVTGNEDKLSLLVKAAEKLVHEDTPTLSAEMTTHHTNSNNTTKLNELSTNFSKLNAFVNSINSNSSNSGFPVFLGKNGKPTRPFKAYPKESLSLPIGGQSTTFNPPLHEPDELTNSTNTSSNTPVQSTTPVPPPPLQPIPFTVNTNSASNSSCPSPLNSALSQLISTTPNNHSHLITPETLLNLLSTLINNNNNNNQQQKPQEQIQPSLKAQNDLTNLNLNDLTSFDISSLAFSPNDFCVQHRKRIQQAQERLLKKQQPQQITGEQISSRRGSRKRSTNNSSSSSLERSPNRITTSENQVDSTCGSLVGQVFNTSPNEEYLNYPPKKRHRIQQQHQQMEKNETSEINTDEMEPSSSMSSSSIESKSPTSSSAISSTTKPVSTTQQTTPSTTRQRSRQSSVDVDLDKDEAYRERRRKNNEAAKRSRDARRAKEDDIALRAALLERENLQLKVEIAQLKQETSRLRCMLYNS